MTTEESVYLYADKSSPLYSKALQDLEFRKCPHTHTVYALMDVEEADLPREMVDHVALCKECQQTAQTARMINQKINALVPSFIGTEPKALYANTKTMFLRNEFSALSKTQRFVKTSAVSSKEMLIDIFSVIFSVKMGVTYILAAFLFYLLNWVF